MSTVVPQYTIVLGPADRLFYVPDRAWPDPRRQHLHVLIPDDIDVVYFDDMGKPSDVKLALSVQAQKKIQARRKTPRGNGHASDD